MKKKLLMFAFILLFTLLNKAIAQKEINISQADARFTLSAKRSSGFGAEEYKFYVQNNTSQEYTMEIKVTLNLSCVGDKSFILGYNRIVYLKPNGKFDAFNDDYVHIYNYNVEKDKNCLIKEGDKVTLFRGISYTITNVKNLTQEKAAAEKKKLDDQAKADADKKKKEADAKTKADEEKKKKEADAKAKADADAKADLEKKKKEADADKKKKEADSKAKATTQATATASTGTTKKQQATTTSSDSKTSTSSTKSNATATKADEAEKKAAAKQKEQEAIERAQKEEEDKKKAEQDLLNKKQADYDKWKTDAKNQQSVNDAASATAFGTVLFVLGEWIYNDKMGEYDPAFSFKRSSNKVQFGLGIDFGYSLSTFPMLFESNISTMSGGVSSTKKEVQAKNPFIINFEPSVRMGVENNNFGGFAYAGVKLGASPIFDGSNLSLQYGVRAYAGIKWVKAYVDYGMGSRAFSKSSTDPEENGSGKSNSSFNKLEYGVRFTVHPVDDLRRSHIYLGMISEKLKLEKPNNFVDPVSGTLNTLGETPTITGYSIQWNKEHTFKLYANVYPEFIYTGEINTGSGALSSEFKSTKTGTFFEFGFVRSINWW